MNYSNTEEAFVLSSLKEFVKVWGSGRQGYFNLECRNGLACVKLSFDLGHPSDLHCHETNVATPSFFQTKPSRSNGSVRQRKNIERAKAHREKLAAVSAAHSSAQSSSSSSATAAVDANVPHQAPAQLEPALSSDLSSTAATDVDISEAAKVTLESEKAASAKEISNQDKRADTANAESNSYQNPEPASTPPIVPVFGIAAFENCPDECLTDDYLISLKKFLGSEQHLSQNITSVEFSPPSSRCFRTGYFTHTMAIVLHVKTDRLWETPASYIRKHLGFPNNEWSKQNGTVVKLSRIHQKSSVAS